VGRESFFVSAGKEARDVLEEVVKASEPLGSEVGPPVELSLSVGAVADFVAAVGKPKDRAQAERLAQLLEESAGSDHVKVAVNPVAHGVQFRLELEEGIVRAIGVAAAEKKGRQAIRAPRRDASLVGVGR